MFFFFAETNLEERERVGSVSGSFPGIKDKDKDKEKEKSEKPASKGDKKIMKTQLDEIFQPENEDEIVQLKILIEYMKREVLN